MACCGKAQGVFANARMPEHVRGLLRAPSTGAADPLSVRRPVGASVFTQPVSTPALLTAGNWYRCVGSEQGPEYSGVRACPIFSSSIADKTDPPPLLVAGAFVRVTASENGYSHFDSIAWFERNGVLSTNNDSGWIASSSLQYVGAALTPAVPLPPAWAGRRNPFATRYAPTGTGALPPGAMILPGGQIAVPVSPQSSTVDSKSMLPASTSAAKVSQGQRQAYDTAVKQSKALLDQYNALVAIALRDIGLLQLHLPGNPPGEADTVAMRKFASQLAYFHLPTQAKNLQTMATYIDDLRAFLPAPGGAPLSPPTYTSPFAVTRGAWLPGMSFIIKPAHFRDMDGEKSLQTFIGKMIPIVNSAIGLGMVPYTDPTLHSQAGWKGVWSSFGRHPQWNTYSGGELASAINYRQGFYPFGTELGKYPTFIDLGWYDFPSSAAIPTTTQLGTSQRGIFAAAAAVLQIPGFKEFMDTAWIVPDGTRVEVLFEHLLRPGTRYEPWARVRFHRPEIGGGGALATEEGFIEMRDLERRMVYSEGAPV